VTEEILTFMVAGWAMYVTQSRVHSNQYAAAMFIFFYGYAMFVGHCFEGTTEYFVFSMISTPVFIFFILQMNTFTLLGLLLCLTEAALLLIDLIGFMSYNTVKPLYVMALAIKPIVTTLQLASLMVRDGRPVDILDTLAACRELFTDFAKSFRDSSTFVVCMQTLYNGQKSKSHGKT